MIPRPRTPADISEQRYIATAHANKATNIAAFDEWLKRHTPLQIKEANHARRRLAQLGKASLPQLHDSRLVKRPRTAYLLYFTERFEHGDFKHMVAKDMIIRVAEEWKGLTDAEKVVCNHAGLFSEQRKLTEGYRNTRNCRRATLTVTRRSTSRPMARRFDLIGISQMDLNACHGDYFVFC